MRSLLHANGCCKAQGPLRGGAASRQALLLQSRVVYKISERHKTVGAGLARESYLTFTATLLHNHACKRLGRCFAA